MARPSFRHAKFIVVVKSPEEYSVAVRLMNFLQMPYREESELNTYKAQFYLFDDSDVWILKRMLRDRGIDVSVERYQWSDQM